MADDIQEVRKLLSELTARVYRLERMAGVEVPPAAVSTQVQPTPPLQPAQPPPLRPAAPTMPTLDKITAEPPTESLESRIGSQWFNRIGIVAVLIGVSYFLKYAFENNWIGPGGRVAIGLLAGIAVVIWSERFRAHGHLVFSWSLKAVGIGTLYLSLWAGFQMYHLFSATAAFAIMVLVTASTAVLAITQDAQILAAFALVGGFATPLLLSTGENHEVALFTYVAVLDIATVLLLAFRPWIRLLIGAFAGTLILYFGWYLTYYYKAQSLGTTIIFATIFFASFALAPLVALRNTKVRADAATLLILPLVNAAFYFIEIYIILEAVNRTALAWVAVALAAVYLLLSRLAPPPATDARSPRLLNLIYIALAVGFLTTAIPLKLEAHWITIGWFIEAAVLMWISYRASNTFLRVLATIAIALGVGRLLLFDDFHPELMFANARFITYVIAIATLAVSVYLARTATIADPDEADIHLKAAAVAVILINVLALVAINYEVHDYFQRALQEVGRARTYAYGRVLPQARTEDVRHFYLLRDFAYSAVFMLYGAALMWVGFWKRSAFLRWQALVLIAITIVKVFTFDVSQLDRGYRILSFIGLGVLLLAVSFIYQRDWLHLSGRGGQRSQSKGKSAPA